MPVAPDSNPLADTGTAVREWWRFPPIRNALIAGSLGIIVWTMVTSGFLALHSARWAFLAVTVIGGWHWVREALQSLVRERKLDIEFLMLAAAAGSVALGMWDEAVALVVLFAIAEGVEEYTHERTRASVRGLMKLVPVEAMVVQGGVEYRRLAQTLKSGDRFRVRPGESISTDGRIVEGASSVNQAAITGESLPVAKELGDEVFAGSINGEGVLLIEATKAFDDNSIARIIHLVEQAQEEKGRAQQWIERFGRRYTPAVFVFSVLLIAVPALLRWPLADWIHKAIVLLVAAAPCALVISTPIAMAAGIRRASQRGILIKGGVHLEHLAAVRNVAFDKTGTLTLGLPQLVAFHPMGMAADRALSIAAALESNSRHPLARAVVEAARTKGLSLPEVRDFASMTGSGISGRLDGASWYVASPGWFAARHALAPDLAAQVEREQLQGRTVSLLGTGDSVHAILALADTARVEASEAVQQLHAMHLRTVLLSGDHPQTAAAIARQVGIDDARGDLKPDQKVEAIQALEREYGALLMVGDGVNDAPALAFATCGAAMGAAGSDAALEAADVALMTDDLRKVPLAIETARDAVRIGRQNIVLSIAVLAVMIPAALLGWIGVTTAVIVHEAAELLAVANGLRAGASAGKDS